MFAKLAVLVGTVCTTDVEIPVIRDASGNYIIDALVTCAENITAVIDGKLMLCDANYGDLPAGILAEEQESLFLNSENHVLQFSPGMPRSEMVVSIRTRYGDKKATYGINFGSELFHSLGPFSVMQRNDQTEFALVVNSSEASFIAECAPETLITLPVQPTTIQYPEHEETLYVLGKRVRFPNVAETYRMRIEQFSECPDIITYVPKPLMDTIEASLLGGRIRPRFWPAAWLNDCGLDLIDQLPEIAIDFVDTDGDVSKLVIPPRTYVKHNPETNACTLRLRGMFYEDPEHPIIFNLLRLEGFNFRLTPEYTVQICPSL